MAAADRQLSRLQAAKRRLLHALYTAGIRQFPGETGHDATRTESDWAVEAIAEIPRLRQTIRDATEALEWAKAPTTDDALVGVERQAGMPPQGYTLGGRIRALYSRERIEANRQRDRVVAAEAAAQEFAHVLNTTLAFVKPEDRYLSGEKGRAYEALSRHPEYASDHVRRLLRPWEGVRGAEESSEDAAARVRDLP